MSGGGGSSGPSLDEIKTAVAEYGDPQFDKTFAGQGDIQDDISDALDRSLTQLGNVESGLTDEFSALSGDIGDVQTGVTGIGRDVTSGFADMDEGFDDAAADRREGFADLTGEVREEGADTRADITDRIDQQDIDLGRAFSDVNDQVLDTEGNLTDQAADYFADLVGKLSTNRTDIMEKVGEEAADTREGITDFDVRTTNTLDTLGSDMREGQGNIQSAVDAGNTQATDYFNTLSEGQTGISDQVTNLQGDFSGFRSDYDNNVTLANRARNDLAQAMGVQGDNITSAVADAAEGTRSAVADTGSAISANVADQGTTTRGALNSAAFDLSQGIEATTAEQVAARNDFMAGLGSMEAVVNSGMEGLDENTKQGFMAMTSAFDENGQLIANDINSMGNAVNRNIDQNGNLLVTEFDANGRRLSQVGYNIEDMMGILGSTQASSIGNTGLLSAPVNTSPYART